MLSAFTLLWRAGAPWAMPWAGTLFALWGWHYRWDRRIRPRHLARYAPEPDWSWTVLMSGIPMAVLASQRSLTVGVFAVVPVWARLGWVGLWSLAFALLPWGVWRGVSNPSVEQLTWWPPTPSPASSQRSTVYGWRWLDVGLVVLGIGGVCWWVPREAIVLPVTLSGFAYGWLRSLAPGSPALD